MQDSRKLEDPSQAKLEERSFGVTRSFIASGAGDAGFEGTRRLIARLIGTKHGLRNLRVYRD
jgi:hypothetical protein